MVNLAHYNVEDDFAHHQKEFEKAYEIFSPYHDLKDAMVLDLCSGTGYHIGFLMDKNPGYVYGVDILDYSALWGGNFKEKFIHFFMSHGISICEHKCQFFTDNAEDLIFRTNFFDFIYCMNAFEHIGDPSAAMVEIWRVLKPGGYAFIQFDPVYYCDTGSHMFNFLPEPWLHLVIPENDYVGRLHQAECPQGIIDDFKYGLNRKPREFFVNLFTAVCDAEMNMFDKMVSYEWSGTEKNSHLNHPHYSSLIQKYSQETLLFRGMNILLRKRC